MNADIGSRLNSIDDRLDRLVEVSEQQQQTASRQQQSIDRLSLATEHQSRDISELRAATAQLVETTRVSQQNIEASNYLAQRNLEAIRDLIQELRDSR